MFLQNLSTSLQLRNTMSPANHLLVHVPPVSNSEYSFYLKHHEPIFSNLKLQSLFGASDMPADYHLTIE